MQRDLVERRGWVSKEDYTDGLALSQLAPGPLAAQLAIFLGWVKGGVWGAILAGVAFVLPSFLMVMAIPAAYLAYGGLPWMQGLFYGIGAAVIAIIVRSAWKLVRPTLSKDWMLWLVFGVNAGVTGWKETEVVWVFLASGVFVLLARSFPQPPLPTGAVLLAIPPWLVTGIHGPVAGKTLWTITLTRSGVFLAASSRRVQIDSLQDRKASSRAMLGA